MPVPWREAEKPSGGDSPVDVTPEATKVSMHPQEMQWMIVSLLRRKQACPTRGRATVRVASRVVPKNVSAAAVAIR